MARKMAKRSFSLMANYTRRDMQFCVSTFMWDIKSIRGVLCATNVTRHATLQNAATRCLPQKSLSSGVSLRSKRNMDVGALKRKGDFVGRANSMQACIPHLLDQPNQIARIGANMKTISREAWPISLGLHCLTFN